MEYEILVTVKEVKGDRCNAQYKVGDTFEVKGVFLGNGKACIPALVSMYPQILAMRFESELPWLKRLKGKALAVCPDGENPVTFEIVRKK
jgi:uncharacterized repeat protein (TIGR04076 family)